jgi:hypothetical protein
LRTEKRETEHTVKTAFKTYFSTASDKNTAIYGGIALALVYIWWSDAITLAQAGTIIKAWIAII